MLEISSRAVSVFRTISVLMGVVSLTNLAMDIIHLPVTALMANVLKTYVDVFHTIFDVIFMWLPWRIPSSVKDVFILYTMVGSATIRAETVAIKSDRNHPWIILHLYGNSRLRFYASAAGRVAWATLFWPLWLAKRASRPLLVMAHGGHGPGRLEYSATRPAGRHSYMGNVRWMIAERLLTIILGTGGIIAINYAFSI